MYVQERHVWFSCLLGQPTSSFKNFQLKCHLINGLYPATLYSSVCVLQELRDCSEQFDYHRGVSANHKRALILHLIDYFLLSLPF